MMIYLTLFFEKKVKRTLSPDQKPRYEEFRSIRRRMFRLFQSA